MKVIRILSFENICRSIRSVNRRRRRRRNITRRTRSLRARNTSLHTSSSTCQKTAARTRDNGRKCAGTRWTIPLQARRARKHLRSETPPKIRVVIPLEDLMVDREDATGMPKRTATQSPLRTPNSHWLAKRCAASHHCQVLQHPLSFRALFPCPVVGGLVRRMQLAQVVSRT